MSDMGYITIIQFHATMLTETERSINRIDGILTEARDFLTDVEKSILRSMLGHLRAHKRNLNHNLDTFMTERKR